LSVTLAFSGRSSLKALAVNLSWPSGRYRLYASLIETKPRWLKALKRG